MFYFDYPKVKHSLGRAALQDPYPAWFLDTRGVIRAANLMAYWLWEKLNPGEPIRPDALLGVSAFNIFADNHERIPAGRNEEFYAKMSAIVKRMNVELRALLCASFIAAMKSDSRLEQIYEQADPYPDHEWEYPLQILPPGLKRSADTGFLEFQITVFRLEKDSGFLVMYTPTANTLPAIEEQYSQLIEQYSDRVYIQPDNTEQDTIENRQLSTSLESVQREYYPAFIHDPLWYIIGENKALQLLVGNSVIGMHFFELFFAPQLREWLGPLQETSAPRAIRYFDVFTARFLREDHELHDDYEQVMKYLLRLQDFRDVLEISRKLSIRLTIPDNPETPFYTCRVLLPWPLRPQMILQFRSMVQSVHTGLLVRTDIRSYQVTLVPENYETEVALMLLHLIPTAPVQDEDDAGDVALKQFLWLLAIVKTVMEGLTRKDGTGNQWEPGAAFGRIRNELDTKFGDVSEDKAGEVIAELRATIDVLDSRETVDKGELLSMLRSVSASHVHLDRLSDFLTEELERLKRGEEGIKEAGKDV